MRHDDAAVSAFLDRLPAERRVAMERVRQTVRSSLPDGYEEVVTGEMIVYQVPRAVYPDTYNKQPLLYAALASQKRYMTLYLMGIYGDDRLRERFESAYRDTGKRYDVGGSCVRFRGLDDLPLEVIGEAVAAIPVEQFVAQAKAVRSKMR